ncbi:DUF99 family protein [Candidatus Bathyarchaeota archaeon]|nr:DUF99 family protein [Candidatus Bathyarchaeota archaeon]
MIRSFKPGLQVVGIDDAMHEREDKHTELAFVFCKGTRIEHFLHASIEVDGMDATGVILKKLQDQPACRWFRLIMLHGITVGGFNVVDITQLSRELGTPIIAVTENTPDGDSMLEAVTHVPGGNTKLGYIKQAGELHAVKTKFGKNPVYFHVKGMEVPLAKQYLRKFSIRSKLPECVLLAHVIATGL